MVINTSVFSHVFRVPEESPHNRPSRLPLSRYLGTEAESAGSPPTC